MFLNYRVLKVFFLKNAQCSLSSIMEFRLRIVGTLEGEAWSSFRAEMPGPDESLRLIHI